MVNREWYFLLLTIHFLLFTSFYRQVFWLSRPLPAFPFDNEQWHVTGKGAYPGILQDQDYSGGTAPEFNRIPFYALLHL
jgi:hypothetical protein